MVTDLTEGFVVAHADGKSARFGYGLSRHGLSELVQKLREVVGPGAQKAPQRVRPPPVAQVRLFEQWPVVVVVAIAVGFFANRELAIAAVQHPGPAPGLSYAVGLLGLAAAMSLACGLLLSLVMLVWPRAAATKS